MSLIDELKVRDLMEFLKTVDPELPVICTRCSDYTEQELPTVIELLYTEGKAEPWSHYYKHQWEKNPGQRPPLRKALHFAGN